MEKIYPEAIERVRHGSRFRIDFKQRNLTIDREYIIKNGEYDGELGLVSTDNMLEEIEFLFQKYQHSIPSERSDRKRKRYFNPLPEEQLSDEDMMYGEPREVAQIALELYVLITIITGHLTWDKIAKGNWFWQSENYPRLIILKEWLE